MLRILKKPTKSEDLLDRCRKGEASAQRQLYEKFSPLLLGVCRRYTKNLEDAEEVLSNTFIKIFTHLHTFDDRGSFEGWMRRIAVREALNFIRYEKNVFVEMKDTHRLDFGHSDLDSDHSTEELMALIDKLPVGYKTVFNLYAIEGFSHKEIADMLEITENTSRSQLHKARGFLQEQLEEKNFI